MPDKNITYEIREHLGTITQYDNGWKKELNIVNWNSSMPKYDIRDWDPQYERMSRGITLHADEMRRLAQLYNAYVNHKDAEKECKTISVGRNLRREYKSGSSEAEDNKEKQGAPDPSPFVKGQPGGASSSDACAD